MGEEVGALRREGGGRGRPDTLVPSPRRPPGPDLPISEKRHRGPLLRGYFECLRIPGNEVQFVLLFHAGNNRRGIRGSLGRWMNTRLRLRCVVTLIEKKVGSVEEREREREGEGRFIFR